MTEQIRASESKQTRSGSCSWLVHLDNFAEGPVDKESLATIAGGTGI
jgi:hypothetical protein